MIFKKMRSVGEGIGKEISTQKEREKDPSKGDFYEVMDDGQHTY